MYKIKRFSVILDKLFSLKDARTEFENKKDLRNLVKHFVLFMCTRGTTDRHWSSDEIPNFIFNMTKEYGRLNYHNKFSYATLHKFYINDKSGVESSSIKSFKDEYFNGGRNSVIDINKCTKFLEEDFSNIFKEFLSKLDEIKNKEKRVLKDRDRYIISDILSELRNRYISE